MFGACPNLARFSSGPKMVAVRVFFDGASALGRGGGRVEQSVCEGDGGAAKQVDVLAGEKETVRKAAAGDGLLDDGDGGRAGEGVGPRLGSKEHGAGSRERGAGSRERGAGS